MRRNYEFYGFNGSLNFNLAAKAADFYEGEIIESLKFVKFVVSPNIFVKSATKLQNQQQKELNKLNPLNS